MELVDAHGLLLVVQLVRILWRLHGALDKVEVVDLVLKLIELLRVWHHPIRHLLFMPKNPAVDATWPPLTKAAGLSQSDNCLILDKAPVLLPDPLSIFLVVASILVTVLVHQVVLDDELVTFEECILVPSPQGCVQQSTGQFMVLRRSIIIQAVLPQVLKRVFKVKTRRALPQVILEALPKPFHILKILNALINSVLIFLIVYESSFGSTIPLKAWTAIINGLI